VGFGSGCATSVLTMPLDTVNTRIKSGEMQGMRLADALVSHNYLSIPVRFSQLLLQVMIARRDGTLALFRGLVPRTILVGFGSTFFWYWNAKFSEWISSSNR
jgi:Mitochondrial carrier protein